MASFFNRTRLPYRARLWEDEAREREALREELAKLSGVDLKKYDCATPNLEEEQQKFMPEDSEPPRCLLVDPLSALSPEAAKKWQGIDLNSFAEPRGSSTVKKKNTTKPPEEEVQRDDLSEATEDEEEAPPPKKIAPLQAKEQTELPARKLTKDPAAVVRRRRLKPRIAVSQSLPKLTTKPLTKTALFGRLPLNNNNDKKKSDATVLTSASSSPEETNISCPLFRWPSNNDKVVQQHHA